MLSDLSKIQNVESRSVCPENFTGEKGKAAMATEGTGANCARDLGIGWKVSPSVLIKAGTTFELANIADQGMIRHIWMTDSSRQPRKLILRMYWDDSDTPSVEAPVGDFFACADVRNYTPMQSLPVCVNPKNGYNCYWEMPFYRRAKITMENIGEDDVFLYYQIDYAVCPLEAGRGYFHAQFRRVNPLPYKEVYTILDNVEGHGQYVGTYLYWGVNNNGWWGEGEIKFYLDGDRDFPTICGTGTEDYFCGSYNFDIGGQYREFCSPYTGLNKVSRPDGLYNANQRFSLYRWHLCDPICFKKDLKVTIQALGWRTGGRYLPLKDDISSVAYWYQDTVAKNFPKLPSVDELEIN